jgi:hypothetical protein
MLRRGRSLIPRQGFVFDRPLLLLQSDDWGRTGVPDTEGWNKLRGLGINLGERPYDYYSLETAEDVGAILSTLGSHRDSAGRCPCLGMNFILANVDFAKVRENRFSQIHLRPLSEGLPDGWHRPGLFPAYREGISAGILSPAMHGATHFCPLSAERYLSDPGERGNLLRAFWNAGVPYIHWRMPWIGFEYADPVNGHEEFLISSSQESLVADAVAKFCRLFSTTPRSACAPGYRANRGTHRAWANRGIRVAQNGPGVLRPPYWDSRDDTPELLHLHRTMDFEPAVSRHFSLQECVQKAESSFARGIPAIVSVHSINFHSTLKDFRCPTLKLLGEFLSILESRHPRLLYVRDEDLYDLIDKGAFNSAQSTVRVGVKKRKFASPINAEAPAS